MGLVYDTSSSYMSKAESAQGAANDWMKRANDIAQAGISSANLAAGAANGDLDKASGYIAKGVSAYDAMTPHIAAVTNSANQVNATAQTLTPYASMMKSYAEQLAANSKPLTDYGSGLLDQSNALMNLDPNAGGLVGQYVGNLQQYSPDRYVALAAADVQKSADNAWAQLARNQSRQGGAANGSGNQAALQAQWARDTAALLAGAKTRAYQTGLNEQTSALRGALADALTMGNTGTTAMSAGNTALSSASTAAGGAANVMAQKGNLEATAGNLHASAGGLQAQQGAGYVSAGNAQTGVANSRISAASLTNSANQTAVNAAIAAAQQQGNFASGWASAASAKDTMDALGIESSASGKSAAAITDGGSNSGSGYGFSVFSANGSGGFSEYRKNADGTEYSKSNY